MFKSKCEAELESKKTEVAYYKNELSNLKKAYQKVQRNFTQLLLANGNIMLREPRIPYKAKPKNKNKSVRSSCPKELEKLKKSLASLQLQKSASTARRTRTGRTGNKKGYYANLVK